MIEIACHLYESGRATAHAVALRFHPDGTVERGAPFAQSTRIERLEISARVGHTARRIAFEDGVTCETTDNDAVDRALARRNGRSGAKASWVHGLESRWRWALLAIVGTVAALWLLVDRGIPLASGWIAAGLPPAVRADLGAHTMELLERSALEESALDAGTRKNLRERFRALAAPLDLQPEPALEFRAAPALGPNALALPGGTVVVTDALVALAERDEEVVAVLAHELGHLEHRHGIRSALQDSAIAVVIIFATGDVSWLATAVPSAVLSTRYSRDFEREADRAAVRYLRQAGIAPVHVRRMLKRFREHHGNGGGFLSSHPATTERIEAMPAGS